MQRKSGIHGGSMSSDFAGWLSPPSEWPAGEHLQWLATQRFRVLLKTASRSMSFEENV